MSTFDPEKFVSGDYGAGSTENLNVPEGEYQFMTGDGPAHKWWRGGTTDEGKVWSRFEPLFVCLDESVRQLFGRDKVFVPYDGGFADIDDNTGRLDMAKGKNVKLNQLREVLDQNKPGWTPSMLEGKGPFWGLVRHRAGQDGVMRHIVVRVAKAKEKLSGKDK